MASPRAANLVLSLHDVVGGKLRLRCEGVNPGPLIRYCPDGVIEKSFDESSLIHRRMMDVTTTRENGKISNNV